LPFKVVSGVFLFVTLLILQALIFDNELSGKIGEIIVEVLSPYIGIAGLWIFVVIGLLISAYMLIEENKESIKSAFSNIKIKKPTLSLPKKQKPKKTKSAKKESEQKVVIKEIGDTAEIILEDVAVDEIPPFDITPKEVNDTQTSLIKEVEEVVEETQTPKEAHATIVEELEENKKLLEDIEIGETEKPKDFKLPPTKFFEKPPKKSKVKVNEAVIDKKIEDLLEKIMQFKIEGDVVRTYTGPIVTTFEFKPAPNVKVSKILNLQDDLAMALKAQTIRIQAPIPGKDVVGIEVPNEDS
jgi:S-DNA-T family DNA segregation ATPase FtsK/SpoIIIE